MPIWTWKVWGGGLRFCIFSKLLGHAYAANPQTTLQVASGKALNVLWILISMLRALQNPVVKFSLSTPAFVRLIYTQKPFSPP